MNVLLPIQASSKVVVSIEQPQLSGSNGQFSWLIHMYKISFSCFIILPTFKLILAYTKYQVLIFLLRPLLCAQEFLQSSIFSYRCTYSYQNFSKNSNAGNTHIRFQVEYRRCSCRQHCNFLFLKYHVIHLRNILFRCCPFYFWDIQEKFLCLFLNRKYTK